MVGDFLKWWNSLVENRFYSHREETGEYIVQLRQNLPPERFLLQGLFLCLLLCLPGPHIQGVSCTLFRHVLSWMDWYMYVPTQPPSQQPGQPWHVAAPPKPPYSTNLLSTQSTKDSSLLGATVLSSKDLRGRQSPFPWPPKLWHFRRLSPQLHN